MRIELKNNSEEIAASFASLFHIMAIEIKGSNGANTIWL